MCCGVSRAAPIVMSMETTATTRPPIGTKAYSKDGMTGAMHVGRYAGPSETFPNGGMIDFGDGPVFVARVHF